LGPKWIKHEVKKHEFVLPPAINNPQVYFVDIPGSKQSVIYVGYLALTRNNPDFVKANFTNYRLGGSFTSILNQILREERGFTYGAFSYFREQKVLAPFIISTSVRSDATFESLQIIKSEMEKYREGITEQDVQATKDYMIKSNALRLETIESQVSMLRTLSKYGFSDDYIKQEEAIVKNMTLEDDKNIALKYFSPDKMIFLVVGDAATQLKPLERIGFGKPILIKQ
jgi:zinc protease